MRIDLMQLNYKDKVEINEEIEFPEEYFANSPIKGTDKLKIEGYIRINDLSEYLIYLKVVGNMYLLDSRTLEKIPYKLDLEIEENLNESLENNQNTLDLLEFLWQNIVLEVPIRYTKSDAEELSGDNWQVLSGERELEIDPRLQKLYDYKGGE